MGGRFARGMRRAPPTLTSRSGAVGVAMSACRVCLRTAQGERWLGRKGGGEGGERKKESGESGRPDPPPLPPVVFLSPPPPLSPLVISALSLSLSLSCLMVAQLVALTADAAALAASLTAQRDDTERLRSQLEAAREKE